MEKMNRTVGVLGGLGPMASVYFYELLTTHTDAKCDQDHLDILLSSKASTPNRTSYILGQSEDNPLVTMIDQARKLQSAGADFLVMPCNTAHYFYDSILCAIDIPMLNIVDETLKLCHEMGKKKIGLLATDGTVESRTYQRRCEKWGIECLVPDQNGQRSVMQMIYDQIKTGRDADLDAFLNVSKSLLDQGCDCIILGCTELSLIQRSNDLDPSIYIDSMQALARSTILACNKNPIGFSFPV